MSTLISTLIGFVVGYTAGRLRAKWNRYVEEREHNREINRTAQLVASWHHQPRTFRRCRLFEEKNCDATLPFQEDPGQAGWSYVYVRNRGGWFCPDHTEEWLAEPHNAVDRAKEEE